MLDERALDILLALRENTRIRFTDLNRVLQNPKTLSIKLKRLEAEGLLNKEGRAYALTEKGEKAARILEGYLQVVGERPLFRNFERIPHSLYSGLLKRYCELLYDNYGDRLEGVVLFGSVARGNWKRESDIDLMVVVQGWRNKKVWMRIEELLMLKERLASTPEYLAASKQGFSPAIQHVPVSPEELRHFQTLYLDVAYDGVVLVDRTGLVSSFIDSVKSWAKSAGTQRITLPDGSFYWVISQTKLGEAVEIGPQS